ncbi:tape measure protein [Intestinimonas butyriciproducens]|uniref:tape measure protein n=1 Tax=Intestinimonas butyriciproducens TaxID=1297617 RepID=UPI0019596282|nr:tape measure protein [Intestinimonas butyriciproducens]MBM6918576.1 tape measure protein [Intestinimonas butyriciproducens]
MATIRTAIQIYDGMTRPLQAMHRATSILINSFESMQRASSNSVDVSSIQTVREELARAGAAFDEIEENIREAGNQQDRFNQNIRSGTTAADGLWGKLKGIAATVGGLAATKKILGLSDTLASTKARLNLIVDDGGSVGELEKKIMASAQRSRSLYFDTASAVASMGSNAKAAFNGTDEIIAFMEQINKQFVIGGASAQGQSAAMLQLTQAMAAGALRGEELNSILENAPGIARAIESYMGIAEGSIKSYAEQGLITAEVVKNAMFAAADETNAKFESMPKTWAQIWTSMQNKALSIFAPILTKINQIGNSERFTQVTDGIINGLAGIASVATWVLDLLIGGAALVVDNWSWLAPIVGGVATAFLVLNGAMLAYKTVTGIVNALETVKAARLAMTTVATGAQTTATFAQTAAQYGLNAALYACPLVWIIILVIALVALFYAAVAAVNKFAGTSVSATGLICGAFMAALAFIGNIFIALWNLVVDVFVMIYNLVGTVANFIGNVFNDPVGAVCRLFFDLADTVLSVLQALASAIDTIFGSNLAGSVQGWRDSLGGWVDSTFGKGEEVMEKLNADDMKLGRFEYGAAFDMGYEFGQGVEDTVGGLFDFSAMDSLGAADGLDAFNLGNTLDGIYGNTGDTAGNTAAMSDALDIAEEDLAYLRDIAEREAINRFTTAEIHVEQHNENHISSDTDLDGIMDAWANDFAEKLDVSEEGVHE